MCITGYLTDFSLPEICQLLDKGHQTALLSVYTCSSNSTSLSKVNYIWVYHGRIVAVAKQLNHQGLVSLISQSRWINSDVLTRLIEQCSANQPLGSYLKSRGALRTKQLKWLFQVQVLKSMCTLFQLQAGKFQIDFNVPPPTVEMTGLSIPAMAATLIGLRSLTNWDALGDKLPTPNSSLMTVISSKYHYRLDSLELQVWKYANGKVSLGAIAQQLRLPVKKVQQIAFQLISVGLVEEVPLLTQAKAIPVAEPLDRGSLEEAAKSNISYSFLQNLVGFLSSKVTA
ncbi:MAG: DUF4388 domain-containing protein [Symploca sp. SIO1B1]|nr:DUF4388 domain-containing protein [Symploca sp. SIO1A3]NER96829.1 DUF4388 domain-containing protein [Symploca sp. SIO1B1]